MFAKLREKKGKIILFEGLQEFREHLGGELTIMLLKGIGQGVEVNSIDGELMKESIAILAQTQQEATIKNSGGGR